MVSAAIAGAVTESAISEAKRKAFIGIPSRMSGN
ncbi:hypothetical protein X733_21295 [Mesorhizobium sp. L2C067A000]|nr:hypothetical protein X733_21295 [Mesorhizobium sp. L2C067A000]